MSWMQWNPSKEDLMTELERVCAALETTDQRARLLQQSVEDLQEDYRKLHDVLRAIASDLGRGDVEAATKRVRRALQLD